MLYKFISIEFIKWAWLIFPNLKHWYVYVALSEYSIFHRKIKKYFIEIQMNQLTKFPVNYNKHHDFKWIVMNQNLTVLCYVLFHHNLTYYSKIDSPWNLEWVFSIYILHNSYKIKNHPYKFHCFTFLGTKLIISNLNA